MSFLTAGRGGGGGGGQTHQNKSGGPKKDSTTHYAFICRVKPGTRDNATPPRVEVLLVKQGKGTSRFHFLSVFDNLQSGSPTEGAVHFRLIKAFGDQCGSPTATPPLTFIKSFPMGANSLLCAFLLPSNFTEWNPSPSQQLPFINYANETIQVNGNAVQVTQGFAWVEFSDLIKESVNQAAINNQGPKNLFCRFGATCKKKNNCRFLHYDANSLPPPQPTSLNFDFGVTRGSITHGQEIGAAVAAHVENRYFGLLASACAQECVLFEGSQLIVYYIVDYATKSFQLKFTNQTTKAPKGFRIDSIEAEDKEGAQKTLAFQFSIPTSQTEQQIDPDATVTGTGQFELKNFFSFSHLPHFQIVFRVGKCHCWARFKLPLFLYRFASVPDEFQVNGPADSVKTQVGNFWGALPTEAGFQVPVADNNAVVEVMNRLKAMHVPVATPFPFNNSTFFPIVMKLGNSGCVILMEFVPSTSKLSVTAKHSSQELFNSLAEVIFGLAARPAGLTRSLLEAPHF